MNQQVSQSPEEMKPLTDWKKEPTVRELKQDLADAKVVHDAQITKINGWLDNLNVTGDAKVSTPTGNSKIVPKLIRKQAEWRYAALAEPFLSTDDVFNVRPISSEDRDSAKQNEILLNNQINTRIDKVSFIDEYVRSAVDEGTVIIQTGWCFEEEEVEVEVPDVEFSVNPELAPLHEQLAQMKAQDPSLYATDVPQELKDAHDLSVEQGVPIEAKIIGSKKEKQKKTIKNHPTIDICDVHNVVIDPTAMGDIEKASFVIKTFESSKSELKKQGKKYKNLDKINIANNSVLNTPDHTSANDAQFFNFSDDARKKFVVHEYWGFRDLDDTGVVKPFVASWVGDVCIRMELNPFPDKALPFVLVQYLPVRKKNYGEPDGALLEDNQKVIGAVTRGMIDIMAKSANGQTGLRKDMLDATNKRKYDKGQDYEFNANIDPRMGVHMHTYPEIPNSAPLMLQMQNQEAESLTGVQGFAGGISGAGLGDVAVGVRGALDAASKRELNILRRLSNGIVKVGRKMVSMNAEFLSDEEVVRVTNEEFVKIRRDDLAGNFDLRLSISTAEEDENKAKELAFMFQTAGPNMDHGFSKMILSDIARLRKMPDLAKKIESYEPQPDPLAQEKAQLEIELLKVKIENERAHGIQRQASAQLDMAKVGTEGVKAGGIQSKTDLDNLNFVEQESGVKQERAKELHGEQARSQAQLKLIDQDERAKDREVDLLKAYLSKKAA